jgi:hypothetical protein
MGSLTSPLTRGLWVCDVCERARPYQKIATATHAHTDANGITVYQYVKYCTDSDTCKHIAHVRSRTDLAARKLAEERVAAVERLVAVERTKLHISMWAAAVAFVAGYIIRGGI